MKKNIYRTAAVVTGLSIAERALGFLYRIVLSRLIGAEGLGLYQVALSVFSVFITLGTGGIPITVSRLISKNKAGGSAKGESGAVTAGLLGSLALTLPVCLIFVLFGSKFTFLFSDERCLSLFSILLIGLVFSSVYAVVRGSFWGNKQFLVPSILELVEESVMVIAGVLLLRGVSDVFEGARLACIAVIISYFVSFSSSAICFFARGGRLSSPRGQLKPLFSSAMPITAVRAGGSLVGSAVAVLLPAMLIRAGATRTQALQLFGVVSGMAIPILSIPSTIIGSISLVLVPELSEDFYRKRFKHMAKNIERGLSTTVLIACTLIPLFFVLGDDVGRVLYSDASAGEMIRKCCFILLPMSLTMISTGILNSLNFEKQTLVFYFIGAALMLGAVLLLPKYIGVYAYPVGLALSYLVCSVCNLIFLCKKCPLPSSLLKKSLIVCALMLPISLIGQFICVALKKYLSALGAMGLTALAMLAITFVLYFFCHIFSPKPFKKLLFEK